MMKKTSLVLVMLSSLLCISNNVLARTGTVKDSMKVMSHSYRAVMQDNDLASFKKDLSVFKNAALSAQKTSLSGADKAVFDAGLKQVVDEVGVIETMADKKGLAPAKLEAKKLLDMMNEYHGKLGV
jgi:soluble cytochrome b562